MATWGPRATEPPSFPNSSMLPPTMADECLHHVPPLQNVVSAMCEETTDPNTSPLPIPTPFLLSQPVLPTTSTLSPLHTTPVRESSTSLIYHFGFGRKPFILPPPRAGSSALETRAEHLDTLPHGDTRANPSCNIQNVTQSFASPHDARSNGVESGNAVDRGEEIARSHTPRHLSQSSCNMLYATWGPANSLQWHGELNGATGSDRTGLSTTDEAYKQLLCDEVLGEFDQEVLDGTTSDRSGGDCAARSGEQEGVGRGDGLRVRVQGEHVGTGVGCGAIRPGHWGGTQGELKPLLQSSMLRYYKPAGRVDTRVKRHPQRRRPGIYFPGLVELGGEDGGREGKGGVNQPSRFCHICLRRAERVALMACGRFKSGLCRKVVCEKCFVEFGYDWEKAVGPGSQWVCTHCRKMCPSRAQCFIYKRTNGRRHQALLKRRRRPRSDGDGRIG